MTTSQFKKLIRVMNNFKYESLSCFDTSAEDLKLYGEMTEVFDVLCSNIIQTAVINDEGWD